MFSLKTLVLALLLPSVALASNVGGGTAPTILTGNVTGTGTGTVATTIASIPAVSGALLTNLTPANISSGTAGISITGNAGTVTNGIYTTGTYSNPAWLTGVPYSILTGTVPTWNQNTTGTAASFTGSLVGDVTGTQGATAVTELHGNTLTNTDWCVTNGTIINCTVTPITNNNQLTNGAGYSTTTGTVTAVSVATANGFSGTSSGGATPALTIVAGAITPTSVNGITLTNSNTPTWTIGSASGVPVVTASSPLVITGATGNITCPTCNTSSANVNSVSGDSALISNSASTGAVTLTLASAAANTVWGNNTGSSAAPGYQTMVVAQLPKASQAAMVAAFSSLGY